MTTRSRCLSPLVLAYVDESYTADRFYLGAVLVDGAAAEQIESGFDAIIRDYEGRFGLVASTEMHGNPLFQGKGEWRDVPTRVRINVYERAMEVVGGSGARVVLRGMNVRRQRERYVDPHPPHEVVLGHLLERINDYAGSVEAHALVLADEVHTQERHRTNFRHFRVGGTPGYRSTRLRRLVDTIHFAPSDHSRLLQAADLVTFMHRRRCTHTEPDSRAQAANDAIWAHIESVVVHQLCWEPLMHESPAPMKVRGPRRCGRPEGVLQFDATRVDRSAEVFRCGVRAPRGGRPRRMASCP